MNTKLYLFRHGETEWAKSGQHTGRTDIPLTDTGREQARALAPIAKGIKFSAVFTSPLSRASETAMLAGLNSAITDDNLMEVCYGDYEGLTTKQIRQNIPDWTVWTHACINGETLQQVAARAEAVISRAEAVGGNVAIFSHGHMLRILTTAWLKVNPEVGRHLMLDTSTLSILSHEHESPAVKIWNAPVNMLAAVEKLGQ